LKLAKYCRCNSGLHRNRYSCRIIHDEILKDIIHVNNKITIARSDRNKFAHFCWSRSTDEEVFGTNFSGGGSKGKKYRKSFAVIKNEELDALYVESYGLVDTLSQIIKKLPELEDEDLVSSQLQG